MKLSFFLILLFLQFSLCNNINGFNKISKINLEQLINTNDLDKDCEKCNIEIVVYIKKNINDLTEHQIYNFLCTIDISCKNNVEFSQFSNEILFLLLHQKTELSLKVFSKYKKIINWDYICTYIADPINDGIKLYEILQNIEAISGYDDVKTDVIEALKIAIGKQ